MRTVRVHAQRPYDVIIDYGNLKTLGAEIAKRHAPSRIALVSCEAVHSLYGKIVQESLARAGFSIAICIIPAGEEAKNLDTVNKLLQQFIQMGMTRSDVVVALGGGVTGDIAGFAASIYLRGIDYVQVPTTLLAAVDASIGGKTGVNLPQGKNLVGAFWQPSLVVCDCDTLETLPHENYLDGVAECLKYGVLTDRALFEKITSGALEENPIEVIARCVQIKASMVIADERDSGRRKLLNLGHTMAHAIEKISGFEISHGHAVAIGMVAATRAAEGLGYCVMGCAGVLMAMLDRLELPVETPYSADALAEAALADKKRHGDTITLVLPQSIGYCALYDFKMDELPRIFRLGKGERA